MKTKILQITSGRGPIECSFVVAQVLKLFIIDMNKNKISYTIMNRVKGIEPNTLLSATIMIEGDNLDSILPPWLGTILWISKSPFRKYHKRKNWFIGFFELSDEILPGINEYDIKYQTMRSQGAGGQHVNKVNSAVRAIHIPTGLFATSMDTRSQHQNKKLAKKRLLAKLYESELNHVKKKIQDEWNNHLELKRGNPVRTFVGQDFKKKKSVKTYKKRRSKLKTELRKEYNI